MWASDNSLEGIHENGRGKNNQPTKNIGELSLQQTCAQARALEQAQIRVLHIHLDNCFYLDASLLTLVLWFLMKSFSIVQLLCCKIGCLLMRSSHSLFPGKLVPTTWVLNSFSTNSISVGSHIRFEGPWKYLLNKKVVSKFKFSFGDLFVHSKPL